MFKGTFTAIVTPFKADLSIDEDALRRHVSWQIENGVNGIVPVGTTGESPTTSADEDRRIFEIVIDEAKGRVPIICGTGSNNTAEAIKHTNHAKEAGADGCLVVCPYYNKPNAKGLKLHYAAIAEVGLPIIIYNIKGRTGINMETDTLMELAQNPNIVAVKEASGDLNQMKEVIQSAPDDFSVLCGDDGLTLELIKMGGHGVVSVAANALPKEMSQFVQHALDGDMETAEKEHEYLSEFFNKEFMETNPQPIKTALAMMGRCEEIFRLPMCTMSESNKEILREMMRRYNLI